MYEGENGVRWADILLKTSSITLRDKKWISIFVKGPAISWSKWAALIFEGVLTEDAYVIS